MDRPNLLYIFTDQQRADTLACYGNTQIQTPNLNALAAQSVVFDNAYVSQPVCSPARATMMTGLWPHSCGVPSCNVPLAPQVPTLADHLGPSYATAFMGKWHLGDEIFPQHGFETWVGSEDSYRHSYSTPERLAALSPYHHFLLQHGFEPDATNQGERVFSRHAEACMDEEFTKAAFLGERAAQFILNQDERPFALCVSYLEPHPPHTGPFNEYYDATSLPIGPAFMQKPPANAPLIIRLMAAYYMASEEYGIDLQHEAGWRQVMARYWGNITLVDRSVGKILQALEASGQADNTLIVFTSDHGEQLGDHGILGKTVMYEESVRVPLLLKLPQQSGTPTRVPGNFSHIDLVPTLLDLLGQTVPAELQGKSQVPVLQGQETLADNDVFIEWNGADGHPPSSIGEAEVNRSMAQPLRTIISSQRWKLNLYQHGPGELYNLNVDPHELENLYDRNDQRNRLQDLHTRLCQWQQRTQDTAELPAI